MEICRVSEYGDYRILCPEVRIFEACIIALQICNTEEEIRETLKRWNVLCKDNKCKYLKEYIKNG